MARVYAEASSSRARRWWRSAGRTARLFHRQPLWGGRPRVTRFFAIAIGSGRPTCNRMDGQASPTTAGPPIRRRAVPAQIPPIRAPPTVACRIRSGGRTETRTIRADAIRARAATIRAAGAPRGRRTRIAGSIRETGTATPTEARQSPGLQPQCSSSAILDCHGIWRPSRLMRFSISISTARE